MSVLEEDSLSILNSGIKRIVIANLNNQLFEWNASRKKKRIIDLVNIFKTGLHPDYGFFHVKDFDSRLSFTKLEGVYCFINSDFSLNAEDIENLLIQLLDDFLLIFDVDQLSKEANPNPDIFSEYKLYLESKLLELVKK